MGLEDDVMFFMVGIFYGIIFFNAVCCFRSFENMIYGHAEKLERNDK